MSKKGKVVEHLGKKCTKFENNLKKSRRLHAKMARNKVPEYALTTHFTLLGPNLQGFDMKKVPPPMDLIKFPTHYYKPLP